MARKVPEINSSSQADIAFLLLCFFLMTTSMDVDYGIFRRLPPPAEEEQTEDTKVRERNVMSVYVNASDELAIRYGKGNFEKIKLKNLSRIVKQFMTPRPDDETAPEVEIKNIKFLGDVPISKGVVSLKNDNGTSYEMYIAVQNELTRAFKEMRDDLSMKKFGKPFDQLNKDQNKAIGEAIPVRISEAEPNVSKK